MIKYASTMLLVNHIIMHVKQVCNVCKLSNENLFAIDSCAMTVMVYEVNVHMMLSNYIHHKQSKRCSKHDIAIHAIQTDHPVGVFAVHMSGLYLSERGSAARLQSCL